VAALHDLPTSEPPQPVEPSGEERKLRFVRRRPGRSELEAAE
jgi:hypothetical protein